jgi:hypothetical protein
VSWIDDYGVVEAGNKSVEDEVNAVGVLRGRKDGDEGTECDICGVIADLVKSYPRHDLGSALVYSKHK